ncbi:MAG: hypothetical protein R8N23_20520 [Reichenbachiella sp.]|uniref:hypothetical protein n=1 Tax=Reichenbachiella sp. TaxID=2184521 RepID=UPI0029670B54|nr:hypothetical protein [Reichenbachiella sp.]MDW3212267.1 hypothetical protein [Reichenbachiella sp.]
MTKYTRYFNTIFYGLIAILFSMCNAGELDFDDIEVPTYTPLVVAPIGQTSYTIENLIEKLKDSTLIITEDNSNLIFVSYRDTTLFDDYLSIIELEDVTNSDAIDAGLDPIPGSPGPQDVVIPTQDLSFEYTSPNNEELDSVKYTAGTITLDIQNGYASVLEYELTLNDIVNLDTGDPMVISGTLPASGSDNVSQQLTNHKTLIEQISNTNIFTGDFDGVLKVKTGDFINGTEIINYTLTITNAEFSEIYGWFGDKTIDLADQSINIDFFEGISENGLVFNNPQLNFYINNAFGVPMGLNFENISTSNADGSSVSLSGTITDSPQFVRAPSTSQVGSIATSVINIDESNSNMRDLLAISPNQFNISLSGEANYTNEDGSDRNFVTATSEVEVVTEINLPLNVKLTDVTRDFPTGIEGFDFEEADTIRLVLNTVNQLPFDGVIDMQFLAADSSVLFEITDILFFNSAEVPSSGKIEEPVTNSAIVKIHKGENGGYQELLDASVLNLLTHITSYKASEDNFVKIFSDYELLIQVGTEANISHEL